MNKKSKLFLRPLIGLWIAIAAPTYLMSNETFSLSNITKQIYKKNHNTMMWVNDLTKMEQIAQYLSDYKVLSNAYLSKYRVFKKIYPNIDSLNEDELSAVDKLITNLLSLILVEKMAPEIRYPFFKKELIKNKIRKNIKYVWDQEVENNNIYDILQKASKNPSFLNEIPYRYDTEQLSKLYDQYIDYRELFLDGGFITVPRSVLAKSLGSHGDDIMALKMRLYQTGDIEYEPISDYYDPDLSSALKLYQKRNGLTVTGKIDKQTLDTLNISAKDRMNQILANMDRFAWDSQKEHPSFRLLINIPEYKMHILLNEKQMGVHKVIVGKPTNPTPVLDSKISYFVEKPIWTIPNSILAKEMLPNLKEDPFYIYDKNISLYNKNGDEVYPEDINWSAFDQNSSIPFKAVKKPGRTNPLGEIKFIFPNNYAVYLHDTSDRSKFKRTSRALSHGCIRLENPERFKKLATVSFGVGRTVKSENGNFNYLKKRIPISIRYFTAWVDKDGVLNFRKDIYGYDKMHQKAIEKMNRDFQLNKQYN